MQTHEFHQHLVGIGGAIKGTGARPVIGRHLGSQQAVAVDFALGELLADFGFLVVRDAGCHRPRRNEYRGQMPECRCRDHQSRHNLVTDAKIDRSVKGVVRECDAGSQRNHIAGKQRHFHAGLPLCHAIAHGGYTPGNLCGATCLAGGGADQFRIGLIGPVGRQHVVIGRDDAEIQ